MDILGMDLDSELQGGGPDGEEKPVSYRTPTSVPDGTVPEIDTTRQEVAPPAPSLTNQVGSPPSVVDPEFMEIYAGAQKMFSENMSGDPEAINRLALAQATMMYGQVHKLKTEIQKTRDQAELSTEEGRAIAGIMKELPAVSKEAAKQIYQKINKLQLEHASKSPSEPSSPRLSAHDRKMMRALSLGEKSYTETMAQLEKGRSIDAEGNLQFTNGFGINDKNEIVFENF